jgi:predicted dehydrogenase
VKGETLRVGVIGAGFVARRAHIPGWRAVPGAEVVAICDTDPAALEAAVRDTGVRAAFGDPRALLDSGVDAVSICTPNASHFPLALAALEAGKHVLCEKPLGVTAAEADALGAAAEARGLVLMAQHQLRFEGPALAARECVQSGRLGLVHHIRVRALRRNRIPTAPGFLDRGLAGGGAALDLGIHALDMALWLAGFPRAARVTGSTGTHFARGNGISNHWGEWDRDSVSVEDFAAGFVTFEDGMTLSLECAWLGHHADEGPACEWLGEKGTLRWPACELLSQGPFFRREALKVPETGSAHFAAIRAFAEAVRSGAPSPVPWREARASIAVIEALYASAREGREVEVTSDE